MTPEPLANSPRPDDFNVAQVWLDALSRGACDEEAFLRAVKVLTRRSPEAGWDCLSLLDQYYRRGKINSEIFRRLKTQLGTQLLGPAMELEISVPIPQKTNSPAAAAAPAPKLTSTPVPTASAPPAAPRPSAPTPKAQPPTPTPKAAPPAPAPKAAPPAQTPKAVPPAPAPEAPEAPVVAPVVAAAIAAAAAQSVPVLSVAATSPIPISSARAAETARRAAREVVVGDVLRGRYVVKSVIGRGGTGTVFEAVDRYRLDFQDAGQRVALKVLDAKTSEQHGLVTDLRREFQLLQSLSHPNVVRAHEYDRDGDAEFFTMEYLSGLTLASVLSARHGTPLERPHALAIMRDVGAALAHAHSRGVVHGDLNPGNVFITNDGEVRVLDFGAARTPDQITVAPESAWQSVAAPRYASCQVLDGESSEARDDIYSLACLAYVLLGAKHPFAEKTAAQARAQRLKPARLNSTTAAEWRALKSALAFDRERRPADVADWLKRFDLNQAPPRLPVLLALVRVSPRPPRRALVPLLGLLALGLLAAGWWASGNLDLLKRDLDEISLDSKTTLNNAAASLTELWRNSGKRVETAAPSAPPAVEPTPASPAPPAPSISSTPKSAAPPPASVRATAPRAPTTAASASPRATTATSLHSRLELAADTIDVPTADVAARILVRRSGSLHGDVTFSWWTESGTAKPGQDFMAVAAHEERIEDGKSSVSLFVPVVADATRRQPKSFYVVINDPSVGATLGRTLTMVTIPASTE